MLPEGAGAQDPAQHLRGRTRCRPRSRRQQGVRAILPRSQARGDAVCSPQAHPQARPASPARTSRSAVRVHTGGHRPEPTPPRQAGGQTATTGGCVRCVSVACVSAEAADPMRASGRQRYRDDCLDRSRLVACPLLQQNLPQSAVVTSSSAFTLCEVKAGRDWQQMRTIVVTAVKSIECYPQAIATAWPLSDT